MSSSNQDFHRELLKIHDVLLKTEEHLTAKDEMNAALHMATEVRATPLASAVYGARQDIEKILDELSQAQG